MAACIDYFSCDGIPDDDPETDLADDDSQRDECEVIEFDEPDQESVKEHDEDYFKE